MLRISEIYKSIQGEGEHTGTPSVFLRTTGCNLRCWYCDTPFTSWAPEGDRRSVADIVRETLAFNCEHVVVTGGEPLLQPDIVDCTAQLKAAGCFITIETAGTVFRDAPADLMSISPKRENSTPDVTRSAVWSERHEQLRHRPDVIRRLVQQRRCQFKFVIDNPDDVADVTLWLEEFPEIDRRTVWLMPQAITAEALSEKSNWLRDIAASAGYRFTSRWHIATYGNVRGK